MPLLNPHTTIKTNSVKLGPRGDQTLRQQLLFSTGETGERETLNGQLNFSPEAFQHFVSVVLSTGGSLKLLNQVALTLHAVTSEHIDDDLCLECGLELFEDHDDCWVGLLLALKQDVSTWIERLEEGIVQESLGEVQK